MVYLTHPTNHSAMKEPAYQIIKCYNARVDRLYLRLRQNSGTIHSCWYIVNGSVRVETAGKRLLAKRGDWVFVEPLTMNSHTFSEDAHILSIRFAADWNNLHFFPPLRAPWKADGAALPEMLEAATQLCANETLLSNTPTPWPPALWARRSELFFGWLRHWHLLRKSASTPPRPDGRAAKALAELSRAPGIAPIDYTRLSQLTGLSKAQINRVFKQSTGQTIKGWKTNACLRTAEDLLLRNEHSVKEIAAHLGFHDASHFSKWFRQHMHLSPQRWRSLQ